MWVSVVIAATLVAALEGFKLRLLGYALFVTVNHLQTDLTQYSANSLCLLIRLAKLCSPEGEISVPIG